MRNRELRNYLTSLIVIIIFFSCQKEKKVEQVQMPEPGYEEILYGPVHTVKLLMYNVTNNGDSLIKKDRFKEKTDLDLPTWHEAFVTFDRVGLCSKIETYKYGTSTIGGGATFGYDDEGRLTKKKFYSGYPFDVGNCNRVFEYEYKKSEGYDALIETEYIPRYYEPARGKILSEQVRELDSKIETFYNKYGDAVKYYSTRYKIDDEDSEQRRSVVIRSDTTTYNMSYEKGILISRGDANFLYDDNGNHYASIRYNGRKTAYIYPNGQAKAYDCSRGTFEDPLGCSRYFNEEGYFLESASAKAKYSQKDAYANWTRMLIGHKNPSTILIGEREITYYKE